jgi:lysophospholipase L1-like esterase
MKRIKFAAAVLIAVLVAVPMFGARGSADFSRLVTLGDSYGAGVENGSLNERHQTWSWSSVLAKQLGYTICGPTATAADPCFAVPLVSYPGIGPDLVLTSLAPTIVPASTSNGTPLMTTFGRPYNNLAVPGATLAALLALKGTEPATNTPTTFGQFILRGLGTQIEQAKLLNASFVALWIGGNDALGSVLGGTDQGLTTAADFTTRYNAILDSLIAAVPNAGMVVGNLPDNVNSLAVANTVPPFIVNPTTRQPVLGPDGKPIYYIADLGGGTIGQLPAGSLVLLTAQTRLGTGFGFPNVPPFNALPNAGKPLPASDVLTPTELANIVARVREYNTAIASAAAARNIPVADVKGLFDSVTVNPLTGVGGRTIGPIKLTNAYLTGGFFSFDGFHLTDIGYLLFANEYIKAINAGYGTEVPLASITQLYANNGALFPDTNASGAVLSEAAAQQINSMWAAPTVRKLRSIRNH